MDEIKKLQEMTDRLLTEAKKKKVSDKKGPEVHPKEYSYAESLDFSQPLGIMNPTAQAVAWGPETGTSGHGPVFDLRHGVGDQQHKLQSAWEHLKEAVDPSPKEGVWESIEEELDEKHLGFKKLKGKLSHEKGVEDPAALAAAIGRKKYGAKAFAAKSAKGRK